MISRRTSCAPNEDVFPDCSTVVRGALRLVTGAPRLVIGAPRLVIGAPKCSQVHLKFSAVLRRVPKLIRMLRVVLSSDNDT